MPICFVKWIESWPDGSVHKGAVVGWLTKGSLDNRVWAVILENNVFVDVLAKKLEFDRWPE